MMDNIEREDMFFQELGHAITAWQGVEQGVSGIYAHIMKGANQRVVSVTFFHIQSFESRVLLVERCAYFAFSKAAQNTWKNLRKRLATQGAIRNRLIHSAYVIEGRGYVQTPTLQPSSFDALAVVRKHAGNPEMRFDYWRLERVRWDFERLATDLGEFRMGLVPTIAKKTEHAKSRRSKSPQSSTP